MAIRYKVEKKIPVPEYKARSTSKYPFASMEVGDSFFVPAIDVASGKSLRQTAYAANYRIKTMSFKVFDVDGGFRVFRVK